MTELKILREARRIIHNHISYTPILYSTLLNEKYGAKVLFKCENFQITGSFKLRGAYYSAFKKIQRTGKTSLAGHSSGNFAQALAKTAHLMGVESTIVMPGNAPEIKVEGVKRWNGKIIYSENSPQSREAKLHEFMDQHPEAIYMHPSDDMDMIYGNSTAIQELIEEESDIEIVIVPVGGGGILAGAALASKNLLPKIKVYGAEPSGADDAARSFRTGKIVPSVEPQTIADGLRTQLGKNNFPIIQSLVTDILTVSEADIITSMKDIYQYLKIVIEPSSAVPLAVIRKNPQLFSNKRIGMIITGGNIDLVNLAQIFK